MSGIVLVTGATGNVGSVVVDALLRRGERVRAAVRSDTDALRVHAGAETVVFDFESPGTFDAALEGVDRVFLMRPPHMADASAFEPFISAMGEAGISRVIFLSLMGVERNPVVPHHAIERLLKASGLPWTMLRPSFYMQNLSTTHLADIRELGEIIVPAGGGRTSLIDSRDIGEAAAVLLSSEGHERRAYTVSGPQAITYDEVARILTQETGREIRYTRPSGRLFARHMRGRGFDPGFVTVMRGIYLVARLRMAGAITDDLEQLLGRPPRTFREFARDHADLFGRAAT